MFELNGKTYTVSMLQAAATKYNMSYDEYLAKMKDKGLKEINQEPTFVQTTTQKEQQLLSDYNKSTKLTTDQQAEIDSLNLDIFNDQEVITYDSTYGDITRPGANVRKPTKTIVKLSFFRRRFFFLSNRHIRRFFEVTAVFLSFPCVLISFFVVLGRFVFVKPA